jgi:hypothetical protein
MGKMHSLRRDANVHIPVASERWRMGAGKVR